MWIWFWSSFNWSQFNWSLLISSIHSIEDLVLLIIIFNDLLNRDSWSDLDLWSSSLNLILSFHSFFHLFHIDLTLISSPWVLLDLPVGMEGGVVHSYKCYILMDAAEMGHQRWHHRPPSSCLRHSSPTTTPTSSRAAPDTGISLMRWYGILTLYLLESTASSRSIYQMILHDHTILIGKYRKRRRFVFWYSIGYTISVR